MAVGLVYFFFLSDSRIGSHSPFACNWQNKFWDSELAIARFPSKKGGNSDIRIPHNFAELHPTPCMREVCCVRGLGRIVRRNKMFFLLFV